ncbi:MAG: hypothetical protein E7653_00645 [Ruminococcaceae bacterium]|nr:hypothetical protein [Oscillospiraceae bacterium]
MNLNFDIKKFILDKTIEYINQMPKDVYVLYYFINTNEGTAKVPTLSLMYNTLSELGENGIEPNEISWNFACWNIEELPMIGDNINDSKEAEKSILMLSEWFESNGYDSSMIIKDPLDGYFEMTKAYFVLSEIIEKIAPEVKEVARNRFNREVVLLLGEYSYIPTDIMRIAAMNGIEAQPFITYCEDMLCWNEDLNCTAEQTFEENYEQMIYQNKEISRMLKYGFDEDSEYGRVFSEFLEKVKKEFNDNNTGDGSVC